MLPEILHLARITACIGLRDEARLTAELNIALGEDLPAPLIREAILQSYLFAGYAAAINAFIVFNKLVPKEEEALQEKKGSLRLWISRGTELCRRIYGSQYEKLVRNMKSLHPDLADWMVWEGYGKVLSRPFLSLRVRELLIVTMTAVLGVDRQFLSHVRGALNVGAAPEEVRRVFDETIRYMDPAAVDRFRAIIEEQTGL
ncbi:MAG TPA: carboxymuconolactone decarboxylase family protein [Acidobacteriota bacterium]|nr:carboxymuconolactone decarboxylase family protein [Acidobacteriota bacterium]